jgi:hypothetical protein
VQNCRSLASVFLKWPICSAPLVILTFSGFHKVKAFTGPADHARQDSQWQ